MTAIRAFMVILFVTVGALAVRIYFQPELAGKPARYGVIVALMALMVAFRSNRSGALRR